MEMVYSIDAHQRDRGWSKARMAINWLISGIEFAIHLRGPDAGKELIQTRRKLCHECEFTDLHGKRLYRANGDGVLTCGESIFTQKLRDPLRDGCGCFLEKKWSKKKTTCPLSRW